MKSIKYLSLLFAALVATAVNAQERVIEEVIVTATKRAESVQDIPLSVNAFSGAQLEEAGVKDIRDIAAQTPGLSIKSRGETEGSVFIRGIGSAAPGLAPIQPSVFTLTACTRRGAPTRRLHFST